MLPKNLLIGGAIVVAGAVAVGVAVAIYEEKKKVDPTPIKLRSAAPRPSTYGETGRLKWDLGTEGAMWIEEDADYRDFSQMDTRK